MHHILHLKERFDTHLEKHIDQMIASYPEEYSYIKTCTMSGGKQVRPLLFLEACQLWNHTIGDDTLDMACGIELIHSFFLIHDDIMDNDDLRRDVPTLHHYFSKKRTPHAGKALALVFGDLLYTKALELITRGAGNTHLSSILLETLGVCSRTAEGQILEFTSDHLPSKEDILDFYKKKTAEYSIFFPLILAALHSQKVEAKREKLQDLSDHLGIAYQLYDDVTEIVGAKKRKIDEERCGDLMRAKATPILLETLSHAKEETKQTVIQAFISQETISKEVEEDLLHIIREFDIVPHAQTLINSYLDHAETLLPELGLEHSHTLQKLLTTYRHAPK